MTLKHSYNSTVAEDPASGTPGGLVGPNEWNADHSVSGTSLQTLFNNAGSLTGMGGTSWDNTNLALTITGATVTTSNPILNLSQTWNAGGVTFTALKLNVTNTASALGSALVDIQQGGVSNLTLFNRTVSTATPILAIGNSTNPTGIQVFNTVDTINNPSNYERAIFDWTTSANNLVIATQQGGTGSARNIYLVPSLGVASNSNYVAFPANSIIQNSAWIFIPDGGNNMVLSAGVNAYIAFSSLNANNSQDTHLARQAARTLQLTGHTTGANACSFQVYNNTDQVGPNTAPTNYERGVFDWTTTANTLTIGTQAGGTGNSRAVQFVGLDFVHGASVATNATDGFLYIPSCAGTPTGTPTTFTGTVPMVYDRTNNKFYIYNSGWKGGTVPGTFS